MARICALIASFNGERTIGATVRSARAAGADVYVVGDCCNDHTVREAKKAGARAVNLPENHGKPGALREGESFWKLTERYYGVLLLDDDTTIDSQFLIKAQSQMQNNVACIVGRTLSAPSVVHQWNPFIGIRAVAFWWYGVTIRRGQAALNAVNVVAGSNTLFRSDIFAEMLRVPPTLIVDDTEWMVRIHREGLGKIAYEDQAIAYTQDPTNFRDWYKQNVRWLWGTGQGVRLARIGSRRTAFDFWYCLQIADWAGYVLSPLVLIALLLTTTSPLLTVLGVLGGHVVRTGIAAIALKRWRLVPMIPMFVVLDLVYRWTMLHALYKTIKQPTVAVCRWTSPARH